MSAAAIMERGTSLRESYARRLRWVGALSALPVLGVAGMVVAMWQARSIMDAIGRVPGAALIVVMSLAGGLALLGFPVLSWRAGNAAAASGLHEEARRAYRCASVTIGFVGVLLGLFTLLMAGLLAWSVVGPAHFTRPVHVLFGLPMVGGAALGFLATARQAHRLAGGALERVLSERAPDRALVYLHDLTSAALDAAPLLHEGERFVFAAKGTVLTTERVLGSEKEAELSPEERSLLDFLTGGELPADEARESATLVARRYLEDGEELVFVAPGRKGVLRWNARVPSGDSGTALTTRQLFQFDAKGVKKSIEVGISVSIREVIGAEPPFKELVLRAGRAKLRLAARPLDATVLLRALLARSGDAIFLPSLLSNL